MKPILTSFLILATSLVAQARAVRNWSDQELFDKSDLVVIAIPTTSADTQERIDLPGLPAQPVIGVETRFAVSSVVKGDKALKNFILHHYRRADEARSGPVANGPGLIAFKPGEKRKFLLFLVREADGRYAPTVGQVDPGFQGIAAVGDPVNSTPDQSPPAAAATHAPNSGVVSDAEAAKGIAKEVLSRLLTPDDFKRKQFSDAVLKDGVWTVRFWEVKARINFSVVIQIRQQSGSIIKYDDPNA